MNNNIKIPAIALAAAIIGLIAGYFIFKGSGADAGHVHDMPAATADEETIYTCSMHPQIRQNEPGLCPICEMDLIPLDANTSTDPLVFEMTEEALNLANVQTTLLGAAGQASRVINLNGKVKADERLAASQVAHVPGRIEKLFVTFTGEKVRQGQKLATIYSPELITAQRELLEALKFQDVNASLVEAARNKLRFWKISDKTIEVIEKEGKVQETFSVSADAGGIVTDRKVSVGDYVNRGEVLFELMNLSKVWVLFDAYEEDLANIRVGDRVVFTTPALPGQNFDTRITYIDPVITPKTRATSVRAEVSNRNGLLKPEMFVRGAIQGRGASKAQLTVPKSAVLWTGQRSVVWVKLPGRDVPSFQYREIVLGDAVGNSYLVQGGLEAGEEVVTYGNFAIDAAAQLNNQQSMMNEVVNVKKDGPAPTPDFAADTPDAFKKQLNVVTGHYLALKDALVETNAEDAAGAAATFVAALDKVDMMLVTGEAHDFWMVQLDGMKSHGNNIAESDDVEEQRKQFSFLSEMMIATLQAFGTANGEYFVQFCPMAMDDKGASWVSSEEGIRNPYFGDKMMKCGEVKGKLQ